MRRRDCGLDSDPYSYDGTPPLLLVGRSPPRNE